MGGWMSPSRPQFNSPVEIPPVLYVVAIPLNESAWSSRSSRTGLIILQEVNSYRSSSCTVRWFVR